MINRLNPLNMYVTTVSVLGTVFFLLSVSFDLRASYEWVIIFALIGAILLLNHHTFLIPPKGNSLSMDSSVYLASAFLFGVETTLTVLFISTVIFSVYQNKIAWWKHLFNFAIYTFMLLSSYYLFIFADGRVGPITSDNLLPYFISLSVYFLINMAFVSLYFYFSSKETLKNIVTGIFKDQTFFISYFVSLLLAMVLGILLQAEGIFGLFLFVIIALLLSIAFDHSFQLFESISEKANKDHLTGLNNHGYFKEILESEITNSKNTESQLSLSLMDIDDFKKYNDLYGHIQGDNLLTFFGAILESTASSKNYITARYGGEEFAILMPDTDKATALEFIDSLRKSVNDTYFDGVEALPYGCLSFSAGIVECEKGVYDSSELLSKADQAMYLAKSQGKNIVQIYDETASYPTQQTASIESDLEEIEQQLRIFLSKDVYTYRHSKRVFQYAVEFSDRINLSEVEKRMLILGALVHDIGKLEIPRDVINKQGKLEPHEWEMIKKHVTWGKEIISTNKKLEPLIPLVELHHERYDGKGYPHGLKGANIPKLARILCIIDSFDAMTTERPYQKTKTFSEAIIELRECAGEQFDPKYVDPFIEMIEQNYSLKLNKENVLT